MVEIVILLIALTLGILFGMWFRKRSGKVRAVSAPTGATVASTEAGRITPTGTRDNMLRAVGVGHVPTVLHFSADWCGPCAAVRRVIGRVVQDLGPDYGNVIEIELDLDENPALAKELGVLSLPTTFIFDSAGTERFRISGVPKVADLQAALVGLA